MPCCWTMQWRSCDIMPSLLLKHRRFVGTGSPIGSRDYSNGGFANGERKCVFLEDGINSSNSKLTMKGKRLNLHALENQKRNLNNRGKWMDQIKHPLLTLIQQLHASDFWACKCCMVFIPLGLWSIWSLICDKNFKLPSNGYLCYWKGPLTVPSEISNS